MHKEIRFLRSLDVDPVKRHLDDLLDEALGETFPSSDPVSVTLRPMCGRRVVLNAFAKMVDDASQGCSEWR